MIGLLHFVLAIVVSPFRSKSRLEAENAVLRQQLIALRRKVKGRAQITNNDRWFFIQLYRWFGFQVARSSVRQIHGQAAWAPSQGWCTFLRNLAPNIAAMDLFVVPTIGFKLLYAFVVVRLDRRDLVWINVTTTRQRSGLHVRSPRLFLGTGLAAT
jgi:hypothetical protein